MLFLDDLEEDLSPKMRYQRRMSVPEKVFLNADFAILRPSNDADLKFEIVAAFDRNTDPYRHYMQSLTCYDLQPNHGAIVVIDGALKIHKALTALNQCGHQAAIVSMPEAKGGWDILTVTDCLKAIVMASEGVHKVAEQTVAEFMKLTNRKHLISADVNASVWDAARLICLNRVHRIPVVQYDDSLLEGRKGQGDILYILSLRSVLMETVLKLSDPKRSIAPHMKETTLLERKVGTWSNIITFHRSPQEHIHKVVRDGNDEELLKLYYKGYDLSLTDQDGNNPLHIAAMNDNQRICRYLVILACPVQLDKMRNNSGLLPEDLAVSDKVRKDLHELTAPTAARVEDPHSRYNDHLVSETTIWPEHAKFLVGLDGGGIRGMIMSQILLHIEGQLKCNLVDRVDWFGGSSCGGLLALILSTGNTVQFGRKFLMENRHKVFCGSNSKVPKHDARGIEKLCQDLWGEAKMDTIQHPRVFVTVTDTRKCPTRLVLFRSYSPQASLEIKEELDFLDPSKIRIWKAARCTSAAPYFFESFNGLSDGGLSANNPIQALLTDFYTCLKVEDDQRNRDRSTLHNASSPDDEPTIGLVLSVGTGVNPIQKHAGIDINLQQMTYKNPIRLAKNVMSAMNKAKTAFNMMVKECTSSNGSPLKYSREWCHSMGTPFFRFSPQLSEDVALDCTDINVIVDMLWQTEIYLRGEVCTELEQLVRLLSVKPSREVKTASLTDDSLTSSSKRTTAVQMSSVLKCIE